ncbi:MAG: DUF5723 family protein [Bacteroidales bacterium]
MKNKYIYIISAMCILFAVKGVKAQYNDISYFMRNIPSSFKMNPANTPIAKFYINMPMAGVNFEFATSGFSYNDIITRRADDSLKVDLDKFYNKLTDKNYVKFGSNIELFGFGFQAGKKGYFSLGLDLNIDGNVNFSKGIFGFILNGTESENKKTDFINNKLISLNAFIAPSISYSRLINDKLTVGARVKLPMGIANITTDKSELTIDFNDDKITATSNFLIRTSNIIGSIDFRGLENSSDIEFNTSEKASEIINLAKKNLGLAFDLGGSYKLNNTMLVSLSIQDLGYINWGANTTQLQSKNPNASYTFNGLGSIDFNDENNTIGDQFEEILDSVITSFDLEAVEGKTYTQMLPAKLYAGFTWNFAKTQYLNALYKGAFGNNYSDHYISIYYTTQLERYLNFSIGNTFAFENHFNSITALNPSIALNLNLYMINIYFGGSLRSSYNLTKLTGVNVFVGMNIAFGYKDYWEKDESTKDINIPEEKNIKE